MLVFDLDEEMYLDLVAMLTDDEAESQAICEEMGVDFDDVRTYDWGFSWQEEWE